MKNFKFLATAILLLSMTGLSAQEYCLTKPFGFGKDATGGTGGSVVTVTNVTDFENALKASGKAIVLVKGTITFTGRRSILIVDKTIIGLPGSKLYNGDRTQSGSGILNIKSGSNNVILRNLTFASAGAYDCDGNDNLCIEGGTNIWVDHCDFQDGVDGNFDNKGKTDNITVTWCRFRYLIAPKAGGSGGSNDHRFSNLLGSSSSDKPTDGKYSMTWAYNWWDQGCVERMLRCRNADLHFISNYWNSSVANYYIGPENVNFYAEGCAFGGNPKKGVVVGYGGTNKYTFVNCEGAPSSSGSVPKPTYAYTAYSPSNTKAYITSSCGAGATLNVDPNTGAVSASCGSTTISVTGVSVSPTSSTITTSNGTVQLSAAVSPSNATNKSVTWSSSNTSVATVSSTGLVTGKANGSATITVRTSDGGKTATCAITVNIATTPPAGTTEVHNFTASGTTSSFYAISGSLSTTKGTVSYNGLTLTQCLKMESATSISFNAAQSGVLTLVFNTDNYGDVKINGTTTPKASAGVLQVNLGAGTHTITKATSCNLFYMSFSNGSTKSASFSNEAINEAQALDFLLYPNPVKSSLVVEFANSLSEQTLVQLFDISGRLVLSNYAEGEKQTIDVAGLKSGMYIIKVSNSHKSITKRFVKQ
jgi:pectate lyase